ncbi:MAG: sodium-dependent transporter [Oscillospiraceae bacterium]
MEKREKLSSRLGFILLSAGCAIGLGNVYRFPYIVGKYGGAAFIVIYLCFLVLLGIPVMTMEFSVGRGSKKSVARSFDVLEPTGTKWHIFGGVGMIGNYLLMMFYTTITGWMLSFLVKMVSGGFVGKTPEAVGQTFGAMVSNPVENVVYMIIVVLIGFGVCALGLNGGVEKVSKFMMTALFALMIILAFRVVTLPGAAPGIAFYLKPDFANLFKNGIGEPLFAAMGQAFFTLSIGMGSMAVFGSYIGDERRLMGESVNIILLDTFVALMSGFIVIPSCFAFGVPQDSGMSLVFITLPNIFNSMKGGRIWGSFFFLFLLFAALTTVIAVFENIVCMSMDRWGWDRKKSVAISIVAVAILALPAALSGSVLSFIAPLGAGTNIIDLEDFIISNNILPLGSLVYVLFCTRKNGWGYENFIAEANKGEGMTFPRKLQFYFSIILPVLILVVFVQGYYNIFFA